MVGLDTHTPPSDERPTSQLNGSAIAKAIAAFRRRAESTRGLAGRTCGDEERMCVFPTGTVRSRAGCGGRARPNDEYDGAIYEYMTGSM